MPYNSETETFYQAPATVVDSTPDGDTVREGFDDRLTPALAGVYADFNLLKADGMISVGIPATTTARGIGRVATGADLVDGATINNGPAFLAAGVNTSVAPAAGKIPVSDSNGGLSNWIGIPPVGGSVSITGATTLTTSAFGKLHICTGTTADYTVTLPAVASSAGKMIAVCVSSTMTKLVTLKGNSSELIDGGNTRIMWAGESATLYCDGTSWYKIAGKTIAMKATKYRAASQPISANTSTLVSCDTNYVSQCPAAMLAGSGVITALRPGSYEISVNAAGSGWGSTNTLSAWAAKNGTNIYADVDYTSSSYPRTGGAGGGIPAVVGDVFGLYVHCPAAFTIGGGNSSSVSVTEVPNW